MSMKIKKMNKKADGSLGINKIITYAIIFIVLCAVLFFIFRAQINDWINKMPGYGNQEDSGG